MKAIIYVDIYYDTVDVVFVSKCDTHLVCCCCCSSSFCFSLLNPNCECWYRCV